MATRKVKSAAKMFTSDQNKLKQLIKFTANRVEGIVGSSLGPGGRVSLIESDLPGIPNVNTKDGVTIFRALGASNPYEHLLIEQWRDVAIRTVESAGDGTTTATILSAALINNLFEFCETHKKYSPQRGTRVLQRLLNEKMLPFIESQSIKINNKNKSLLKQVAQVSANGDEPMANAVMEAFESVGYGASSHVTIQQLSGPQGFDVELIEGFPIAKGYEESIGKFHNAFINDQAKQRCILDKPLFILFDGNLTDIVQFGSVLENIGDEYANGNSDYANVVLVAHGFSEKVLTTLSYNFANPNTINVIPLKTPMDAIINSELNFLLDLSAFTGAKVFDMNNPLVDATPDDFGSDMERIEIYRFRTTVIGEPDPLNIEARAEDLSARAKDAESKLEKSILEEKLGKLTNGIARLKIFGSSNGELKEMADRAEDAVCAVRAAIKHGCLPGGCRVLINLAIELQKEKDDTEIISEVLVPSLLRPFHRLLSNAGYAEEEIEDCLDQAIKNRKKVYNIETGEFDSVKKLGIYDATLAVKQALTNAVSISKVIGTMGGIIVHPRDSVLERSEAADELEFQKDMANPNRHVNEANERA